MKVRKKKEKRVRRNKIRKRKKIYGKGLGIFRSLGNLLSKTRDRRWG